jgi:hypothetical protein
MYQSCEDQPTLSQVNQLTLDAFKSNGTFQRIRCKGELVK